MQGTAGVLGDRIGETRRCRGRVGGHGEGSESHGSGDQNRPDRSKMTAMTDFVTLLQRNRNIPVDPSPPTGVTSKPIVLSTQKTWSPGILIL